jgi:hypothetical protein
MLQERVKKTEVSESKLGFFSISNRFLYIGGLSSESVSEQENDLKCNLGDCRFTFTQKVWITVDKNEDYAIKK